jgi:tRNA threonylcarbamoyl adenosine modification protein (Sua5/YciO/YrdC/YwlC family)
MAQFFSIHPTHPQGRLIKRAAAILRAGGLIAYPTDSCYALGCHIDDAKALERLRRLRGIDEKHHLTLMCRDLSEIATYAMVDDAQFKLLKAGTPGT